MPDNLCLTNTNINKTLTSCQGNVKLTNCQVADIEAIKDNNSPVNNSTSENCLLSVDIQPAKKQASDFPGCTLLSTGYPLDKELPDDLDAFKVCVQCGLFGANCPKFFGCFRSVHSWPVESKGVVPLRSLDTVYQVGIFPDAMDAPAVWLLEAQQKKASAVKVLVHGLHESGFDEMADKIEFCGVELKVGKCQDCGTVSAFPARCQERLCPYCANARAERLIDEHYDVINQIRFPKMMTLTFLGVERINRQTLRWMRKCYSRLLHSKLMRGCWGTLYAFEFTYHAPGVWYEITLKNGYKKRLLGAGWHVHIHAIIGSEFIDQVELGKLWERISGAPIVDIRAINPGERADGIREVVKYATKMVDFVDDSALLGEFIMAVEGMKLVQGTGALYKVSPHKATDGKHKCPVCGSEHIDFKGQWGFRVRNDDIRLERVKRGFIYHGVAPPEVVEDESAIPVFCLQL